MSASLCFLRGISQNLASARRVVSKTDSFGSGTRTRLGKASSHLLDPFFRAGHRVVQAVVLVDDLPQLGEGVVLLQRVGAFGLEILEHGRFPHRPVNHVRLSGEVLEGPADAPESVSASKYSARRRINTCCGRESLAVEFYPSVEYLQVSLVRGLTASHGKKNTTANNVGAFFFPIFHWQLSHPNRNDPDRRRVA